MMNRLKEIENVFRNFNMPEYFGGNADEEDYLIVEDICDNLTKGLNCTMDHGVSKAVLIFNDEDWVLKIPFNSMLYYAYDPDSGEYDYNPDTAYYEKFCYAPMASKWDYCNVEYLVYQEALELGLECFFAETDFYCSTRNGYPIYIQEKVTSMRNYPKFNRCSEKSETLASKSPLTRYIEHLWVAAAIEQYGEEKVNNFFEFLSNKKYILHDLHYGNYGFRADGSPCILDFSGWKECY